MAAVAAAAVMPRVGTVTHRAHLTPGHSHFLILAQIPNLNIKLHNLTPCFVWREAKRGLGRAPLPRPKKLSLGLGS